MKLRAKVFDDAADVYLIHHDDVDRDAVHLICLTSPQEGYELFRLLDSLLSHCVGCQQVVWVETAGWCDTKGGPRCEGCGTCSCCERIAL